jgi:lambda family phage portal protein
MGILERVTSMFGGSQAPSDPVAISDPIASVATELIAHGAPSAQMTAYDGASRDDHALLGWDPQSGSADADLLPDLGTLSARSRDLARNNGLMAGAMQTMRDSIVGSVLRLSSTPDYKLLGWERERAREWGNRTEALFRSYAETTECDAGRTLNLLGLTTLALGGGLMNGDALALPMWLPRQGSRWNTRLMMVESDRLATPPELSYRADIRGGIQFDSYGAPLAYYFLKRHPGDGLAGLLGLDGSWGLLDWEKVPAFTLWGRRRVIHLHDKERTGQSRGRPLVAAVMREFHMAGKYGANELQASLASSLVAAFLESNLDEESAARLFGEDPRSAWNQSVKQAQNIRNLKGAAVIPLPAGAKLQGFAPNRPNAQFEAFMENVERRIAAGMNLSREQLLKDFSKTNYSSARATLLEVWRYFLGRRRWLVDYWLKPIYELWLEEAINAGEIEAPDFYTSQYAYTRCRFIFGGKGWVDPVKEAQAAAIRILNGFSTLEQECAEQGLDYEEVLDQLQLENKMRADRGLATVGEAAKIAASVQTAPEDDKADKTEKEAA